MRTFRLFIWGAIFYGLVFVHLGCEDETQYKLTSAERSKADTIYLAQIDTLKIWNDSVCNAMRAQRLQPIIDSIITLRKREAAALKARNRVTDEN